MNEYVFKIKVPEGEVDEALKEMEKAMRTLWDCYHRLDSLGILTFEAKETTSGN